MVSLVCDWRQTDLTQRLEFIRSQINTAEVLLRRLYNWDVIRRRKVRDVVTRRLSCIGVVFVPSCFVVVVVVVVVVCVPAQPT